MQMCIKQDSKRASEEEVQLRKTGEPIKIIVGYGGYKNKIKLAAYKLTEKQIKEIREELSKAFSVKYIRVEADTMRIVIEDAVYGDLEKLEKMGWR